MSPGSTGSGAGPTAASPRRRRCASRSRTAPQFLPRFRVALADWDGDGRLDVVAALSGTRPSLYLSRGSWTADSEVGATRPVAGSPDHMGTQPCVIDWDGDGRLDLVSVADRRTRDGSAVNSEVVWHRNLGGAGPPRLSGRYRLASLPALETITGLSAGDWDGDGWPDLIVGYVRGSIEGGSYRCVAAGIRVYPAGKRSQPGQPR